MFPDDTAPSNPSFFSIFQFPIFYSIFSNNLPILLAISDTTADQTAPFNQGLFD